MGDYLSLCKMNLCNAKSIKDVILTEETREQINQFVAERQFKNEFVKYGVQPDNRMLLYGASGTGKTYLTTCLGKSLGLDVYLINVGELDERGDAIEILKEIFQDVRGQECILLFDECDSVGINRANGDESAYNRHILTTLFQLLDTVDYHTIIVATTNLFDNLDDAFIRRFMKRIRFDKPSPYHLLEYFESFKHPDLTINAEDCPEYLYNNFIQTALNVNELSYYGIKCWVESATKKMIMNGETQLSLYDIVLYALQSWGYTIKTRETGEYYIFKTGANI